MRIHRAIPILGLLLVACSRTVIDNPLPPEEVLRNTARVSQSLDSADFSVDGSYTLTSDGAWEAEGDMQMQGTVSHTGEQLQLRLSTDGELQQDGDTRTYSGDLEVIVVGQDEVYMNLHSLEMQPAHTIFRADLISQFAEKWWLLPSSNQEQGGQEITPDPRVLQAQSQVVRIVKDNGVETLNGRTVYFYEVAIDPDKLIAYLRTVSEETGEEFNEAELRQSLQGVDASGYLWIDTETFHLQRVEWNIGSLPLSGFAQLRLSFTATMSNHNAASPIQLPENALPLSPANYLPVPDPTFSNQVLPGVPAELEDQMVQELLQDLQSP